ncbi:alpha/beta hydrolase [Paenibacillus sp. FSL K6-1230]|uniref:alpha/beta hydrolase n=1 Tax=Paenibacillus sp. FSL K6-1230 TaxID=2921603 RepID=UPI0030FBB724
MKELYVELEDKGGRMAGILHLPPQGEGPYPAVIYCPGKNGERYEVHRLAVKLARRLSELGIAMLRFDYIGLGLSDGHYYQMTTSSKLSNVSQAYSYMAEHPEIDSTRLAFLGFSDGAKIALLAANQTSVQHIVLWSPLFHEFGGNYPNGRHPRFVRHPEASDVLVMPWAGLWISMDFYRDLATYDAEAEIRKYAGESILIYGEEDPLIQEEFEQMQRTDLGSVPIYSGDARHVVHAVREGGHLFTSVVLEQQLMRLTSDWLMQKLGVVV